MKDTKRIAATKFIAAVANWFVSAGFIFWGWTIIAPHLNAPIFTYWEIFGIRMMLSSIITIFKKNKIKG